MNAGYEVNSIGLLPAPVCKTDSVAGRAAAKHERYIAVATGAEFIVKYFIKLTRVSQFRLPWHNRR